MPVVCSSHYGRMRSGEVFRREANDLLGASKRWQAKGHQEEYEKWVDQFYSVDHFAFIQRQFQPLYAAEARLFGRDDADRMNAFIAEFLEDRTDQAKGMSHDHLAETVDRYVESASQKFLLFVQQWDPAAAGTDDMEEDYDW